MAVQAQYLAHAFPHDSRVIRPALDNATSASVFLRESAAGGHLLAAAAKAVDGNTVFSDPRSDLTCNNNNHDSGCLVPRKRARVGDSNMVGAGLIMEGHRALLPPMPVPQAFAPAGDVRRRVLCSGAASTSGRPATAAPVSHGLVSHLCRHSVEIDALVRIENDRLRAGLAEAQRRHIRAVVSAVERAAARRLRDAEAELERALWRNAELDEKLRQMGAEGQAWHGIAKNHEAVAAGLRATIDQLLQSPCAGAGAIPDGEGAAEDAQSCCFEQDGTADGGEVPGGRAGTRACKACGEAEACVLLLPCRHLCLCGGCEAAVDACPVCAATKNASLHVLLS
ncbi:probable BOI-related E3 ubiquitin-protein ligase 2 [Phragmites australis]|uniref:probable BOI-related E3 ubiquitin-protein ligase 2 n=1 Tax=Phragmites australis TaxID=29695 RepID=UPI002D7808DF|nr:probable BOI-related E3 ubiquitin-protein ligase 2 [Phragmites australis]